MIGLVDLHCDTASRLYEEGLSIEQGPQHVVLAGTRGFSFYVQLAACFCPPTLGDDEGYLYIKRLLADFKARISHSSRGRITSHIDAIKSARVQGRAAFVPTVEDARILAGDLRRVMELRALGVRLMTLTWSGESLIGGAWNTEVGLSDFGKAAVSSMLEHGIIPDVSHASQATFFDIAHLARAYRRPFVATHSNAFSVTPHRRNLADDQIREIAMAGGVIGLNLYPPFLTATGNATLEHILHHLEHLIRVGGEDVVAIGTDFDGVDSLPDGISSLSDLPRLSAAMSKHGFSDDLVEKIFYKNAYRFLSHNL